MNPHAPQAVQRVSWYPNGDPCRPATGRHAPRAAVVDLLDTSQSVVEGCPDADEFVRLIVREMRIRYYQPGTVSSYRHALVSVSVRLRGNSPSGRQAVLNKHICALPITSESTKSILYAIAETALAIPFFQTTQASRDRLKIANEWCLRWTMNFR